MSDDFVLPLESAKFIIQHAKHVYLNNDGIDSLSHKVKLSFLFLDRLIVLQSYFH